MRKYEDCTILKLSNYKYVTNIAIVTIFITIAVSIFNQYKSLQLQLDNSELSISSLNTIKSINYVVHSLQKERGISAIYYEQKNEANFNSLSNQREQTSKHIKGTQEFIHVTPSIKSIRADIIEKIDSMQFSKDDLFNGYTDLIQNLLHVQYEQILHVRTYDINNKLFFYKDVSMLQEVLGQLRAKVGSIIASKNITKSNLLEIRYLQTLLNANIKNLKLNDEHKDKNKQIEEIFNDKTVLKTLDIVNRLVSTSSLSSIKLNSEQWYDLSTDSINKLFEFTAINLNTIYEGIIQLKQKVSSDFIIHVFLWLSGLIGIIVLMITSHIRSDELDQQHNLLVDYKRAVDYRTIISKTDPKGIITYANEAFCKVSGYTEQELLNENHNIIRHSDMPASDFKKMWAMIKNGKTWEGRIKNKKKDGGFYWVNATVRPVFDNKGKIKEYIAMRHDITDVVLLNEELVKMQTKLKEQTIRDPLTNLYNRRHLQDISQNLINISKRDNTPLSIIILDIDNFKKINDTYGHSIGDEVIKRLSALLTQHTRQSDVVARIGGEEFVILLPNTDKNGASIIADSLRKIVEKELVEVDKSNNIQFTISLGVENINHETDKSIDEALKRADKALYIAKESGRNRVAIFTH